MVFCSNLLVAVPETNPFTFLHRKPPRVLPTVEPPNKGHIETSHFVFSVKVVLVNMNYCNRNGVQKCVLCWEVVPSPLRTFNRLKLAYRLDNITATVQDTTHEDERDSQLDAKLQSIEDKLDSVLQILSSQMQPGT